MKAAALFLILAVVIVNGAPTEPIETQSPTLPCEEGESISPFTGQCEKNVVFYVANYPDDCLMDVGCLPLSEKPADKGADEKDGNSV